MHMIWKVLLSRCVSTTRSDTNALPLHSPRAIRSLHAARTFKAHVMMAHVTSASCIASFKISFYAGYHRDRLAACTIRCNNTCTPCCTRNILYQTKERQRRSQPDVTCRVSDTSIELSFRIMFMVSTVLFADASLLLIVLRRGELHTLHCAYTGAHCH